MIGFQLNATGTHSFKHNYSAWTEGSLWLLKQAVSYSKNQVVEHLQTGDLLDSIEGGFAKLKEIKFANLCFDKFDFDLQVTGSFNFRIEFRQAKSSTVTCAEFLWQLMKQKNEMGDQVMIALCDTVENFKIHCLSKEPVRSSYSRELVVRITL